jgi:carboxypeptidase PM20D1
VSEKGLANVVLAVRKEGGHASTPPRLAATVRLARAIMRLERRQFPTTMSPAIERMVLAVGQHAHGALGVLFRGVRLTRPLVTAAFARVSDETRAMVRTTMAVTELRGSAAPNVLAESASATVNVRIAVGSSVAEMERHIRRAVADDRVTVTVEHASEPSPISPSEGPAWDAIVHSIEHAHPGVAVVPYVMYAASDARHFTRISDHVYRFFPFHLTREERGTLHAIDERIHVSTWLAGIRFYSELVRSF